jgi:hypothetical protein
MWAQELTVQQELAILVHDIHQSIGHAPNQLFGQFDVERERSGAVRVRHVGCGWIVH